MVERNKMEIAKWITVTALTIAIWVYLICFVFSMGCANITIEEPNGVRVQVNTLFKDYKIDELVTKWGTVKNYDSNSNPMNVMTPYGTVHSK